MRVLTTAATAALILSMAGCNAPAPETGDANSATTGGPETATQAPVQDVPAQGGYAGDPYADRASWPPITSENYAAEMSRQSQAYDQAEYKPIFLEDYICGDNCYVRFSPDIEGGGDGEALCSADQCGAWERAGRLPASLKGKRVGARFGTGPQVDGSGTVMRADFPRIEAFRFSKRDGPAPARGSTAPATPIVTPTTGVLPLRIGVYVAQDIACDDPPNSGFRIYDGQGISGSSTKTCRLNVASTSGGVVRGSQSCINTYDQSRTDNPVRVTVRSNDRFLIEDGGAAQSFRRCETRELPQFLKTLDPS